MGGTQYYSWEGAGSKARQFGGGKKRGKKWPQLSLSGLSDKLARTCFCMRQQWHLMAVGQHCSGDRPGPTPGLSLLPLLVAATLLISSNGTHDGIFGEVLPAMPKAHPAPFLRGWHGSWPLGSTAQHLSYIPSAASTPPGYHAWPGSRAFEIPPLLQATCCFSCIWPATAAVFPTTSTKGMGGLWCHADSALTKMLLSGMHRKFREGVKKTLISVWKTFKAQHWYKSSGNSSESTS